MSTQPYTVLVVDDERDHADGIVESLEKFPVRAIAVYSGLDALDLMEQEPIDIVITDLKLGGEIDGMALLEKAKTRRRHTEIIMITAYATIDTCKEAIRQGAFDYLVKPIDIDQLRSILQQVIQKLSLTTKPIFEAQQVQPEDFIFEGVLGGSTAMRSVIEVARRVARTNISVLIEGESGTGKELLARAIHQNSPRRHKIFQPVNCAGLTESLLESELFGHAKGAFTGAANDRKGFFEVANEGTLFLDEIGDMPTNMQAKLLRVLEDGVIIPVGSTKSVVVDVRIISATNQNFQDRIAEREFREDLYFRIKGVNITLPPLRQRQEDIPALIDYFMREACDEIGAPIDKISPAAQSILTQYEWPGNVRQLRNCIRTMVVMCDRSTLDVQDLPPEISHRPRLTGTSTAASVHGPGSLAGVPLNELERQAIADTLAKTDGNREKAAKILGIGERTLYRKIKEYEL